LIQSLFEDSDEEVRWKAAAALGKIGDERAVEPLIDALDIRAGVLGRTLLMH